MYELDIEHSRPRGYSILTDEELHLIEKNTDYILANIGIDLHDDPISIETLKTLGATTKGKRVYSCGKTLRAFIKKHAPAKFTWKGRTDNADVLMGGKQQIFAPVYGPPEIHRIDDTDPHRPNNFTRKKATIADYRELVALCDTSKALQTTGFMLCYVHDIAEKERHIAMAKAHLELSDKPFMGTVISEQALLDIIQLVGKRTQQDECNLIHLINSSPPLRYQENALKCLRAASLAGEASLITSYSMMGATSPVTIAGVVAQAYAEVLLGLALAQLYKPGVPVIFGLYGIPFSMSAMIPMFGHPNSALIQLICGQLARSLGIPFRADAGITSSNIDDAQAGYEGGSSTSIAISANADFVLHTAGWLLNGMCTSPSKLLRESQALETLRGL